MAATAHIDLFATRNLPPAEQWPDMLFDKAHFDYPERLNCIDAFLDGWVSRDEGERPCVFSPTESLTYAELQARVNRICNVLVNQLGLVPGGRVLLRSANNPMMVATYLAVLKAGGIVVATMPLLRSKEIAYQLNKAEIAIALCCGHLAADMDKAKELSPGLQQLVYWGGGDAESLEGRMAREGTAFTAVDTAAEDICLIAFTSGTTGEPKGTMHNHRDMLAICDGYAKHVLRVDSSDRFIGSAPFAFTFGLGAMLFPMRVGGSFVVLERAGPDDLPPAIKQFRATVVMTAPTAYRAMLAKLDQYDLSSLRKCVSAGEALPKATYEAWLKATGLKLLDGLGGTEMLHIYISAREEEIRPGATGKPLPGYTIAILDEAGKELPRGQLGRLAVRGPVGCRYLADARQTKYVQNGWNITGDTFIMDAEDYLWYQARSDDMIISAGYNIAGPEVENALLTHPAVAECGVIGVPDAERGSLVKAYIVLRPGHEAGDALRKTLQDHAKAEIAPYKYPRAIEFVEALPKTMTGKLQRFQLRKGAETSGGPTVLQPPDWPRPRGYSNGMAREGRIVLTGGVVGWDKDERFPDGLVAQTRQALENIKAILAEGGATPADLMRLTWYVVDMAAYRSSLPELGRAYREVFGAHYPAMALVQVVGLVEPAAKVEIEATAVIPIAPAA